jgi:hypothetical protein
MKGAEGAQMRRFPKWVPSDVIDTYERLARKEIVPGLEIPFLSTPTDYFASQDFSHALLALRLAIESPDMEKAWLAINRRRQKVPPKQIAMLIFSIPRLLKYFDLASDKKSTDAWRKLAVRLQAALTEFRNSTGQDPSSTLEVEAAHADMIASHWEEEWDDLDSVVGHKSASNVKRSYLVRTLATRFRELYDQPLYATVSALAATLLDEEPLDPDHVRKLVKGLEKRPQSHWDYVRQTVSEENPDPEEPTS